MEIGSTLSRKKRSCRKCPCDGVGGEVAIRRRDDAHVHLDRARAADALELLLLQHAQQLGLQIQAHLADLVEQERALVRALERAFDALDRAGERALLVAEEGALDQTFGEGGAVQLDERAVATVARVVDGAREQLLAGARFALEQDGGARRRGGRDGLEQATDLQGSRR